MSGKTRVLIVMTLAQLLPALLIFAYYFFTALQQIHAFWVITIATILLISFVSISSTWIADSPVPESDENRDIGTWFIVLGYLVMMTFYFVVMPLLFSFVKRNPC